MPEPRRFPKNEKVHYSQKSTFISGEKYIFVMGHIMPPGKVKYKDMALRAKPCRDGLEVYPFHEAELRTLKTDRELLWTVTDEGNDTISLWSDTARRYLNLNENGIQLSKKKQSLTVQQNGTLVRFGWKDKTGQIQWIRLSLRAEAPYGLVFTSGPSDSASSFAMAQRVFGISKKPQGKRKLTVGTFSDIHIDYGIQLQRPYLRRGVMQAAKGYAKRYDLDALILCGDSISDNGSHPSLPRGGALQGKWPYDRWLKTRNLLHKELQKSFHNPLRNGNIFHLTGNHDYQVGDRQPEGKSFNSAYYTDLLPADIMYPLIQKVNVDVSSDECLLCYEYQVNNIPFLVLNTPVYPLVPGARFPERANSGHTAEQYEWLENRLQEIKDKQGYNAVVFVSSHYPFWSSQYAQTKAHFAPNYDVYVKMSNLFEQFPNLFFFYGHAHSGDTLPTLAETSETMESIAPISLTYDKNGGDRQIITQEHQERGRFHSDVLETEGFHHMYAGSISFYETHYFANDGRRKVSGLTEIDVPFIQGCTVEVYEDRAVVTMNNFGPKAETLACLPGSTYKLKPLTVMLKK